MSQANPVGGLPRLALSLAFALAQALAFAPPSSAAAADVPTQHGDEARMGVNTGETALTPAKLKAGKFRKLYFRLLDGNTYAQPLYASQIVVNGKARDVIFVATQANSVYAFDDDATLLDSRDAPANPAQLWKVSLGPPIQSGRLSTDLGKPPGECRDITTQVGITGAPVLDRATSTLYVVAKTLTGTTYAHTLHALDARTGATLRKVPITGDVPGKGMGSAGGRVAFDPLHHFNRPGLLLDRTRDVLYVGFCGHCDVEPFHGWLFAFKASDLTLKDVFCTTPNINDSIYDGEGGIWMSGQGPALDDDGNVYLSTGNGSFDGVTDFGNCVIKLAFDGAGKLKVQDFFVPTNQDFLKRKDTDLGSCGVLLLKAEKMLIAGGKEGMIYLLDTRPGKMGTPVSAFQVTRPPMPLFDFGVNPPQPRIGADGTQATRFWNIHGGPVMWNNPGGRFLYVCGEEEPVKVFSLVANAGGGPPLKFASHLPTAFSDVTAPYPGAPGRRVQPSDANGPQPFMPGGILTLSANQASADPGKAAILWALMPLGADANRAVVPGVLRAFDAANFEARPDDPTDPRPPGQKAKRLVQIWASDAGPADNLGMYPKFCAPTVVNGRVVVTAFNAEAPGPTGATVIDPNPAAPKAALAVYGLVP